MAAGKNRSTDPSEFFTADEQDQIISCIQETEKVTAAEIRVRIERTCPGDAIEHCRKMMNRLGITKTAGRTGILIYCSIQDHKVAIFGDEAIHAVVGTDGWKVACEQLVARFSSGDFTDAICDAIRELKPLLAERFPAFVVNPNELSDKPSFGK